MHGTPRTTLDAIDSWKKQGITKCVLDFNCGGDQMGDMTWKFFKDEEEYAIDTDLKVASLLMYFNEEIFNAVEFYVNSDSNYMGESGEVIITLENDLFTYDKVAESEYEEDDIIEIDIEFTEKTQVFIKENIAHIELEEYNNRLDIHYSKDLILGDEENSCITEIHDKFRDKISNFEYTPKDGEKECDEQRSVCIYEDDIKEGNLKPNITIRVRRYEPSEN